MSKMIPDTFRFCPRCGAKSEGESKNPFSCGECDFLYYFNPAIAVAGVIVDAEQQVLFLRRGRDPGKGLLGLPGGFVDSGESTEDALIREVKEETNLDVKALRYITSLPNTYTYREITYSVADIFYVCEIDSFADLTIQASEIDDYQFCHPTAKELGEMAFASNRKAVEIYLQQGRNDESLP